MSYTIGELKQVLENLPNEDDEPLTFLMDYDQDGYSFECWTENGNYVFGESLTADEG
jgi:hypothetical protein